MKKLLFVLGLSLVSITCTENGKAKNWGGTQFITLEPNEVLENVTWKETNLWILTKDTLSGNHIFREKSPYGVIEGTIVFTPEGKTLKEVKK